MLSKLNRTQTAVFYIFMTCQETGASPQTKRLQQWPVCAWPTTTVRSESERNAASVRVMGLSCVGALSKHNAEKVKESFLLDGDKLTEISCDGGLTFFTLTHPQTERTALRDAGV